MIKSFDIYVPLKGFKYSGSMIELVPGLMIDRLGKSSSFDALKNLVSKDEWDDAFNTKFWLQYKWEEEDQNTAADTMNLVLLSLWLVKPNRVEARLRFKVGKNESKGESGRSRILDRMQWIADEGNESFSEADMLAASSYYKAFRDIYKTRGRLSNAMILTLNGCWSYFWQAAFISHAAATETILTYSKKPGLTKRLALSFACLTEKVQTKRDDAYKLFIELYGIRSDIIHGRIHTVEDHERLPSLSRFQNLSRNLWRHLLENNTAMIELDKPDKERKVLLCKVSKGYSAPNKSSR